MEKVEQITPRQGMLLWNQYNLRLPKTCFCSFDGDSVGVNGALAAIIPFDLVSMALLWRRVIV